jgi:hypothetical protein
MKAIRTRMLALALVGVAAAPPGCVRDARDIHAARETPARRPTQLGAASWGLCRLLAPANDNPGIYGSDLGYTVPHPRRSDSLAILFGDTWARPVEGCRYALGRSDDLIASLPLRRPDALRPGAPTGGEQAACKALRYELTDERDPTSWRRIRLFPNAIAESADSALEMGEMRTPLAAWSSGEAVFALFMRSDPAYCDRASDCPHGMKCSSEPAPGQKPLGLCNQSGEIADVMGPAYCRNVEDCPEGVACEPPERGVCMAEHPFTVQTEQGELAPTWYREDPRRAVAYTMYVAAALWPDRPSDFAVVHRFATHRFVNATARTVAHFDPDNPQRNDYRPGSHTLLIWGRSWFFGSGGVQRLPYLLYQPLDALRGAPDAMRWQPRFFAGFESSGKPRWSEHESEAQPIYGTDDFALTHAEGGPRMRFGEPEFDYVNQMALSWIAPLQRWVMLYGGDLPAFMIVDPKSRETPDPVHLPPSPGAIHLRTAPHPWGRARGDRPPSEGWTSPLPLLTRQAAARYLACGRGGREELPGCVEDPDPVGPLDTLASLPEAPSAGQCIEGELQMAAQHELSGNPIGRLYAPNVIDEWTEDVSAQVPGLGKDERAVELYWNVSTWSPYQVVLVKSRLVGRKGNAPRRTGWLR